MVGPRSDAQGAGIVAFAANYLRFHQAESGSIDDEADRAATRIDVMVTIGRSDEAWPVIVAAIEMTEDDQTLANLGAGDLEQIVRLHGTEFIDRIEEQVAASGRFRRALSAVSASDSAVWHRITASLDEA